jgi:YVTN family beta-propeller protein
MTGTPRGRGRRTQAAASAVGLVLALGAQSAGAQTPRLYVANQDDATVSIIDVLTNEVVETVDFRRFGFAADARPHHTQVEPDGSFWYVSLIGAGTVLKLDRENRLVAVLETPVPGLLALDPVGDLLVVGRSMSAVNPPSRLALLRRTDMSLVEELDVFFPRPHALAFHPDGGHVYVASLGVNQLAVVGIEDGSVALVDVPGPPRAFVQLAVSPDRRVLVLTAQLTGELLVFDLSDPSAPRPLATVATAAGAFEPTFTRDGQFVYVTNLDADTVSVVDAATWQVVGQLGGEVFGQPHGVATSPDGRFVYVGNRHQSGGAHDHVGGQATGTGTVVVICAASRTVERVLEVGHYAAGMSAPSPTAPEPGPGSCR